MSEFLYDSSKNPLSKLPSIRSLTQANCIASAIANLKKAGLKPASDTEKPPQRLSS